VNVNSGRRTSRSCRSRAQHLIAASIRREAYASVDASGS
jgi:hypothetical protein